MRETRVLIVEDEQLIALDLEVSLRESGYTVVASVASGTEAVAKAKALRPEIILMDIVLKGGMDGITAATKIKEELGLPVIYLTAFADDETLQRAKITEPYGYLLKPFNPAQLKAALEMTFYRRRLEGGAATQQSQSPTPRPLSVSNRGVPSPYELLSSVELFANVSRPELKSVAMTCRYEDVAACQVITLEGDSEAAPFVVASGRIAMTKMSAEGKELAVELVTPRDAFGLISALDRSPASLTARAQLTSKVLWVPRSSFLGLLEHDSKLHRALTEFVTTRLRKSHEFALTLAHQQVEARVASMLCSLAERPGVGGSDGSTSGLRRYKIKITRQELAELVGNSIETVIRITKDLERSGLLTLPGRGQIEIVDFEGLRELAGQPAAAEPHQTVAHGRT